MHETRLACKSEGRDVGYVRGLVKRTQTDTKID